MSNNISKTAGKADPFDERSWDGLRERLEKSHTFPCCYIFKFIVPRLRAAELTSLLNHKNIQSRASRYGKYVSVTIEQDVASVEEVVMVYQKAASIPGIIAL